MKTTTVKKVYEIGIHAYDNTNRETAYRVLLANGRRCWLIGFGGDYMPAKKSDIENIYNRKMVTKDDDGSDTFETAISFVGSTVYAYNL